MSKGKKKGGEINLADLPPWKSLNVSINFNTCKRSANKIIKQITKLAENEEYITVVTRNDVINSAKDNMLYVDMENLTEKQKKEKGLEELPTVLTAEILAKGCKFLIEEADVTHRQVIIGFFVCEFLGQRFRSPWKESRQKERRKSKNQG